jgi:hypothetical protein
MEGNTSGRHKIQPLDDTNYASWSFQMRLMLQNEDLWETMNHSLVEFAGEVIQDGNAGREQYLERVNQYNHAQKKAMELIGMNVTAREIKRIRRLEFGIEAWNALRDFHLRASNLTRSRLKKQLYCRNLQYGENMKQFLDDVTDYVDKLAELGEELADLEVCGIIVMSLTPEYDNLITTIDLNGGIDLNQLMGRLISEHERRKMSRNLATNPKSVVKNIMHAGSSGTHAGSSGTHAGSSGTHTGSGGTNAGSGGTNAGSGGNNSMRQGSGPFMVNENGRKIYPCHSCGNFGHYRGNCPNKENQNYVYSVCVLNEKY